MSENEKLVPVDQSRLVVPLRQHDVIEATFRPKRTDDLKPGAKAWIGRRGEWECYWIIEGGPYDGQMAIAPKAGAECPPFAWVPECDLEMHATVTPSFIRHNIKEQATASK